MKRLKTLTAMVVGVIFFLSGTAVQGQHIPPEAFMGQPHAGAAPSVPPGLCLDVPTGPNAFSGMEDYCPPPDVYSFFTVDIMAVRTGFDRNPAFTTNREIIGAGGPGTVDFEHDRTRVFPRLNLHLQFAPLWGVRASWFRFEQTAAPFVFTQSDPTFRTASEVPLPGVRVDSPETYLFLNELPTMTLFNPLFFNIPNNPLPPFPFQNSQLAGFPDTLTFESWFRLETFDFELARYIEIGNSYGSLNAGLRYAYISQNYRASRHNQGGGPIFIPGFDPFVDIDDDAELTIFTDRRDIFYGHNFRGVGPRGMFNLETPIDASGILRVYTNFGGAVLMGNRTERGFVEVEQSIRISDMDRNIPPPGVNDLDFGTTISASFRRNRFTVVPMGELEVGLAAHLGTGAFRPVIKLGFVGQYWLNAGNATNPNANFWFYGGQGSIGVAF